MLRELQLCCAVLYIDNKTIFGPYINQHLIDLGEFFRD